MQGEFSTISERLGSGPIPNAFYTWRAGRVRITSAWHPLLDIHAFIVVNRQLK